MKYTVKDGVLVRLDPFTPDPEIEGATQKITFTVNEEALKKRLSEGDTLEVVGGTVVITQQ